MTKLGTIVKYFEENEFLNKDGDRITLEELNVNSSDNIFISKSFKKLKIGLEGKTEYATSDLKTMDGNYGIDKGITFSVNVSDEFLNTLCQLCANIMGIGYGKFYLVYSDPRCQFAGYELLNYFELDEESKEYMWLSKNM